MHEAIDKLKRVSIGQIKRLFRRMGPSLRLEEAKGYVGTDAVSGQLQLELLKREGCRPNSKVLEIGCGCLHAGAQLIRYLDKGHYVGIEPNEWLIKEALTKRRTHQLVQDKNPRFLSASDFDASGCGETFDYVLSHSVLSHCAHWQLGLFIENTARVLAPHGKILASIRLAEGNLYGSSGTTDKGDSKDHEWQYPGVSWFTLSTVTDTAHLYGLDCVYAPEHTEFYTKTRPNECHDWLLFWWKTAGKE